MLLSSAPLCPEGPITQDSVLAEHVAGSSSGCEINTKSSGAVAQEKSEQDVYVGGEGGGHATTNEEFKQ